MKVYKREVYDFLFKTIILLAVYDGIRHNSVLYGYSFIKEVFTLVLLIVLLYEKKFHWSNPIKNVESSLLILYLITVGTLVTLGNTDLMMRAKVSPGAIHVKTIEFFLILYLFNYYTELTLKSVDSIVGFFINAYVFYIVFNVISYFIHFPFITEFRPYVGRISSGYPTADSQSMSFAFALLIFSKGTISKYKLKFIILSIGIIIQATTTGIATYVFLTFFVFLGGRWIGGIAIWQSLKALIYMGSGVIIMLVSLIVYIDEDTINSFYVMISSKSEFIIYYLKLKLYGIESETGNQLVTGTYNVRGKAVDKVMSIYNGPLDLAFGRGTALASLVENQYSFMIRAYGYIGLFLYGLYFVGIIRKSIKIKNGNSVFLLISLVILMLSNVSQITSYLYQISVAFSITVLYCFNQKREVRNEL